MEVLFHFVFTLGKVAVQSFVYSLLFVSLVKVVSRIRPNGWVAVNFRGKSGLFVSLFPVVAVGLLVFMCTHWGSHGLGDSARIPIGHARSVENFNWTHTYVENGDGMQVEIGSFAFDKDFLYAKVWEPVGERLGVYMVWNLEADNWRFYQNTADYLAESEVHNFADLAAFEDFDTHYDRYWRGWRFWLLP